MGLKKYTMLGVLGLMVLLMVGAASAAVEPFKINYLTPTPATGTSSTLGAYTINVSVNATTTPAAGTLTCTLNTTGVYGTRMQAMTVVAAQFNASKAVIFPQGTSTFQVNCSNVTTWGQSNMSTITVLEDITYVYPANNAQVHQTSTGITFNISTTYAIGAATMIINNQPYAMTLGSDGLSAYKTLSKAELPQGTYTWYVANTTGASAFANGSTNTINDGYVVTLLGSNNEGMLEVGAAIDAETEYVEEQKKMAEASTSGGTSWLVIGAVGLAVWYFVFRKKR